MAGLDGSIFEQDFETAVAMPIGGGICTWNSDGSHLARTLYRKRQEIIPYSLHVLDRFTIVHVVRICVRTILRSFLRKI